MGSQRPVSTPGDVAPRLGPGASWETILVLSAWVTIRGVAAHAPGGVTTTGPDGTTPQLSVKTCGGGGGGGGGGAVGGGGPAGGRGGQRGGRGGGVKPGVGGVWPGVGEGLARRKGVSSHG